MLYNVVTDKEFDFLALLISKDVSWIDFVEEPDAGFCYGDTAVGKIRYARADV